MPPPSTVLPLLRSSDLVCSSYSTAFGAAERLLQSEYPIHRQAEGDVLEVVPRPLVSPGPAYLPGPIAAVAVVVRLGLHVIPSAEVLRRSSVYP